MRKILLTALVGVVGVTASASFTVATFADPSTNGATPLFTWDTTANTLAGSWLLPGLTLQAPGFTPGGVFNDVKFEMTTVKVTAIIPNVLYTMSAGVVNFWTSDPMNPIFTISFDGGTFLNPFNAGSSFAAGNNITFGGPNIPGGLSQEQFSFSFANPVASGDKITYTGSFTSSAVPEPASLLALGAGLAMVAARRRNRR